MDIQLLNIKVSFLGQIFTLETIVDTRPVRNDKIADSKVEIVLLKLVPDNKELIWNRVKSTGMLYAFENEFKILAKDHISNIKKGLHLNFIYNLERVIKNSWLSKPKSINQNPDTKPILTIPREDTGPNKPDKADDPCPMCGGNMVQKAVYAHDDYEGYRECHECSYRTQE